MSFTPLYQQIMEQIRADFLAREQSGGDRLPTERELQARYGVSRPTISKALTALAAEGHLIKAQGRGNFLLSNDIETPPIEVVRRIGFVGPVSAETLVQRAFRGVDRAAHHRTYHVLMGSAGNSVAREETAVQNLIAAGVRGLVIYPVPRPRQEAACDYLCLRPPSVPVVLIDTCTPEQGHAQVIFDNQRAGHAMTNRLIAKGHRRIAVITYSEKIMHGPLIDRMKGYLEALKEHNIPFDPSLIRYYPQDGASDMKARNYALDALLRLSNPPTALMAPEDMDALELIELLQQRRVRVPEEICVVGFDNREVARRFRPAFMTTQPDFERMGEMAGDLLLDAIESGEELNRTYVLEAPLLIRRSPEHLEGAIVTVQPERVSV